MTPRHRSTCTTSTPRCSVTLLLLRAILRRHRCLHLPHLLLHPLHLLHPPPHQQRRPPTHPLSPTVNFTPTPRSAPPPALPPRRSPGAAGPDLPTWMARSQMTPTPSLL